MANDSIKKDAVKKLISIHLVFFCLLFLVRTNACEIDIFAYAEPDNIIKVYSYKSITEAALAEMKFDDFIGTYTYTPIKSETTDNAKTVTIDVASEGLPDYFPTDYSIQYVQTKGEGYFSLEFDAAGNKTEHLILPDCAAVGDKWETSTFWDKEGLISQGNIELPIGRFENCIAIERVATQRTDASKKVGENQLAKDIRCPGIGLVSSTTTNTINAVNFQTVTTMVLKSYRHLE